MHEKHLKNQPHRFGYESMGTSFAVTIWDDIDTSVFEDLRTSIISNSHVFDETYSRFKKSSLVWQLTKKRGVVEVPKDLTAMLEIYKKLNVLSDGALNPFVGFALSDLGYDAEYSLKPKAHIRPVPDFQDAVTIIDDTHLELKQSVLIDLGAIGKGYFVDTIASYLKRQGIRRFLVNGSGDIYYCGNGTNLRAGLEHPADPTKVIGIVEISDGALCASASNRRTWGEYHHTIDPKTLTSPHAVIATWVKADTAALADGLCTCLFLTQPERYRELNYEYCLLSPEYSAHFSPGFGAELF